MLLCSWRSTKTFLNLDQPNSISVKLPQFRLNKEVVRVQFLASSDKNPRLRISCRENVEAQGKRRWPDTYERQNGR